MSRSAISVLVAAVLAIWTTQSVSAQDSSPDKKPEATADKAAADKPADSQASDAAAEKSSHEVKAGPLKIEVNLSGVFESLQMEPVAVHPKAWSSFSVVKAVPHGTKVSKGDQLVWLDMSSIEDRMDDTKKALKISKMDLEIAELELDLMKKTLPMDLELAERSKKQTDENLIYFLNTSRPQQEKSAKFSLKSAKNSLEYAQEELDQLEKMYEADDLTEESEEIVLKRARNDVERSEYMLESTELRTKKTLETDLPRDQVTMEDAAKRATVSLARSEVTLPAALAKKTIEVEKQQVDYDRNVEKFKELENDRDAMIIRAPINGYVYYGSFKRGSFSGIDSAKNMLKEGGKLSPHSVFMTVVALRPMRIRVDVPEKELYQVKSGVTGTAVAPALPETKMKTKVTEVSMLPIAAGNYDGQLEVNVPKDATTVVPGMSCKVTLKICDKKDVLTVPASAVFVDESDDQRDLVYLASDDGKATKQKVVVGQKADKTWEIVKGLKAGDKIMLEKPEAE